MRIANKGNVMSHKNGINRRHIAKFTVATSIFALAYPAALLAQGAPQSTEADQGSDSAAQSGNDIVITGSRIRRPNEVQATPITTVGSAMLENRGVVNVSEILNTVPAVGASNFSAAGSPRGQFVAGLYTADLRSLGNSRTLLLVDGRRYVSSDSGGSSVDISTIPTGLIDRVDVTTGGASAVYGSDAISGVVNFILKKNFQGLNLDSQVGISSRGDSRQFKVSLLGGTNFADNRGSAILYASFDKTDGLMGTDRAVSADGVVISDPTRPDLAVFGPASYTVAQTAQGVFGLNGSTIAGSTIRRTILPDGTIATPLGSRDGINPNKFNIVSLPQTRYLAAGRLRFELSDDLTVFADATYARNKNIQQLDQTYVTTGRMNIGGPTGLPITIPTSNPFIPAAMRALIPAGRTEISIGRDLPEFGGRLISYNRQLYRAVAGLESNLPWIGESWKAEAYYEYGRSTLNETMFNGYNTLRLFDALQVESNGAGGYRCASAAARATGCIPVNFFTGQPLTAAEMAYLRQSVKIRSYNEQQVAAATISGDLFQLPGGAAGFAAGAEYRNEKSSYQPDDNLRGGTSSLQYSQPTLGSFNVKEVYAELSLPLLKDLPFAYRLEVEGAYRYADYSSSGGVSAWKVGGSYAPIRDIRFRGVYSRDVRAPNIGDLGRGAVNNRVNTIDPCRGGGTTVARQAYCLAQPGITAAFAPASPTAIQQLVVGNPNLKPEIAKTLTAGAVLAPSFVPGLTLSVDYYQIKIKGAITTLAPQVGIDLCADTNDPFYCSTVVRDRTTGILLTNNTVPVNAATEKMKGVDAELHYRAAIGSAGGTVDATLNYTRLISYDTQLYTGAAEIGLKGQPFYPEHKANFNLAYTNGPFNFALNERYVGKVYRVVGGTFAGNAVPAFWYTDVQARYTIDEKYAFYVGAKNLFDKKPPLFPVPYTGNASGVNTASAVYDIIGAYVYTGISFKF
jgi:iron complex outermembrane receptor protein